MSKKTASKKTSSKKSKTVEQRRKEAIAIADRNISRLDGEALAEGARANSRKAAAQKSPASGETRANKGESKPKVASKAKANAGANTGERRQPRAKTERKPSGLDLAAAVLAKANEPLNAKTIAERAITAGWKTNGATPHATLYAAMVREIRDKGKAARFKKTDRGLFTAVK